jgi:hypothetical protein
MDSSDALEISRASDVRKVSEDVRMGVVEDQRGVYEIDAAVEKQLRRKLDSRLITLLFAAYLLAFLDRSNIGNAEAAGMGKDLGFDDAQYQVGLRAGMVSYDEILRRL